MAPEGPLTASKATSAIRAPYHAPAARRGRLLTLVLALCLVLADCSDDAAPTDAGRGDASRSEDSGSRDAGQADAPNGPDAGAGPDACSLAPGMVQRLQTYRFEAPDVRVHLVREFVRSGTGESSIYKLNAMRIQRDGECTDISEADRLDYENSHHNWADKALGTGAGVRYALSMAWQAGLQWKHTLNATDLSTGKAAFAPVALVRTGGPIFCWECPSHLPIHISEFMPHNASTYKDDTGRHSPWIELYNPSSSNVDISGYTLSNDAADPGKWAFPTGTVIARHKVLMVIADGQPDRGPLHTSFSLSPKGGVLRLSAPDGTSAGERGYGALGPDVSMAMNYETDAFGSTTAPTPGTVTIGF